MKTQPPAFNRQSISSHNLADQPQAAEADGAKNIYKIASVAASINESEMYNRASVHSTNSPGKLNRANAGDTYSPSARNGLQARNQSKRALASPHAGQLSKKSFTTDHQAQEEEDRIKRTEKLWELMGEYIGHDKTSIQKQIVSHIEYTLAKSRFDFNDQHCCQAVKGSLFDRLIECGNDSNSHFSMNDCKRAYILSD